MVPESDSQVPASWAITVFMGRLDAAVLTDCAADGALGGAVECGERLLAPANDDCWARPGCEPAPEQTAQRIDPP